MKKEDLRPWQLGNWAYKLLDDKEVWEALQHSALCPPRTLPVHPPQPTDEEIREELANRSLSDEELKTERRPLLDALRDVFCTTDVLEHQQGTSPHHHHHQNHDRITAERRTSALTRHPWDGGAAG